MPSLRSIQSIRSVLSNGAAALALSLAFSLPLLIAAAPAVADTLPDDHVLCDALEQARDPLYEVPMGTEDWTRINALENAAKALDCAFMINE
ncbi:MAG TPA: hypothetical protein VGN04_06530 [Herbaspirillum sp.]|jgi:hypothetical protein